jgi:hypothetical protein
MASTIMHRGIAIVILADGEALHEHCKSSDIAIRRDADGWWTFFVGDNGQVDSYDAAFSSRDQALWAAKAAAEYGDG